MLLQILEEREYHFKKEIVDLKTQLQEARRSKEEIDNELKYQIKNCEKLKAEVVSIREEFEKSRSNSDKANEEQLKSPKKNRVVTRMEQGDKQCVKKRCKKY